MISWAGRRFHWSLRWLSVVDGPLGLGVRVFLWAPAPGDWSYNVDFLLPIADLQFGFHGWLANPPGWRRRAPLLR